MTGAILQWANRLGIYWGFPKGTAIIAVLLALSGTYSQEAFSNEDKARQGSESALMRMFGATVEPSRRMRGKGFKWDHEIQIALPASYHKTKQAFPTLWVMDGHVAFARAVETAALLRAQGVPEMIVVGVGAPPEALAEAQMRRSYDFTPPGSEKYHSPFLEKESKAIEEQMKAAGMPVAELRGGAPSYLSFLVDSVRTTLAREYRMSEEHALTGSSGGGIFCTYVLLTRPEAFNRYICLSPAINVGAFELFKIEEQYAQTHKDLSAKVFFAAGEGEILEGGFISAWGIVSSTARMAETLKLREYPSLDLHVRIFPGEVHSTMSVGLGWGLRMLWEKQPGK